MNHSINHSNASLLSIPFSIIIIFYVTSYWFFSYWVLKNSGINWVGPFSLSHHPFQLSLFDQHFFQTLLYMFMQSPFYSILTWIMIKMGANEGFVGYIILHYIMGFFAIICLYKIMLFLRVNRWLVMLGLIYFVFNPFFYLCFTSGFYDFLTMCLVSINCYFFLRLLNSYSNRNLLYFMCSLMVLVLYRSLYHPLLFFLPVVLFLLLIFKAYRRKIILISILPFVIVLAPYIKNYIIYDMFDVAAGSFGLAMRASTYEYKPSDLLIKEVDNGSLSKLVLCYKQILEPLTYHNELYTPEKCYTTIIPGFATVDMKHKYFSDAQLPLVIQDKYNGGFGDNYIPNTLTGLIVAKQMAKDAKSYLFHHPFEYLAAINNNLVQLFRSNIDYPYIIANNWRQFPDWFTSNVFSFNFFKIKQPAQNFKFLDLSFAPQILLGMLASIIYAFLYIARVKNKEMLSMIHFLGLAVILIPTMLDFNFFNKLVIKFKPSHFMDVTFLWSFYFVLIGFYNLFKLFINKHQRVGKEDNTIWMLSYILFICLYSMAITSMIPGSEQERYRFIVEGLLISLFLFWITNLVRGSRSMVKR